LPVDPVPGKAARSQGAGLLGAPGGAAGLRSVATDLGAPGPRRRLRGVPNLGERARPHFTFGARPQPRPADKDDVVRPTITPYPAVERRRPSHDSCGRWVVRRAGSAFLSADLAPARGRVRRTRTTLSAPRSRRIRRLERRRLSHDSCGRLVVRRADSAFLSADLAPDRGRARRTRTTLSRPTITPYPAVGKTPAVPRFVRPV